MSNDTVLKLLKEVRAMRTEISEMRSVLIPLGKTSPHFEEDSEGEYRPEFIKSMKRARREKGVYTFTTPEAFLKIINKSK